MLRPTDLIISNFDLLARQGLSANYITFAIKLEINFIVGECPLIYYVIAVFLWRDVY